MGEYLEFIQDTNYEATSLSEQRERDEWFDRKDLSVKNNYYKTKVNNHKSNINVLSTGWWEAAARAGHGRVRRGGGACWVRVQTVIDRGEVRFLKKRR